MKWAYIERAQGVLAREGGAVVKDWGGKLAVALVYPNTYQVGMSSLGFQAVYRLLNALPDVVCERAFWQPGYASQGVGDDPVVSIEGQRPLADFDVIAFSLSFEMDYPHLVQVLRQGRIPLRADEREEPWPLVIAGGPAVSANPLPLADYLDGVVVGEAEEIIDPLVDALWEDRSGGRPAAWEAMARLPGLYVPPLAADPPGVVQHQWVHDLEAYPTATVVHTPDTEFGGMHLIEVARGCARGCRFCLASYICRPKREHSVDSILAQAREGLKWTDRVGLVSAAVSDYSQIDRLATELRRIGARISVSSLRVDPLSEPLLQALAESGTQTLTMALEAGSERLRALVRKGVTEAQLLVAAERAAAHRFRQLKLYFMLGLPTESEADVDGIVQLCEATAARFSGQVIANVTPFVPKAHTPLQWAAMTPREVVEGRLRELEARLQPQGIAVRSESPGWAEIQGILARGDRQLGAVLATLQGTSLRSWHKALAAHGLEPVEYLHARELDEPLPWAFIQQAVQPELLKREWRRAQVDSLSDPCPSNGCVDVDASAQT